MSDHDDALRKAHETMRRVQHEVRTPLSQIMGYSELVEEELVDRGETDLGEDLRKIRAAAARLLDLLDGKLKTEQDPGAPPLPAVDDASAEPRPSVDTGERERPPRVLVVDDDPVHRDLLLRRLGKHGFEVDGADDGIDALRRIDGAEYDAVVLDVMIPGMSGLEVVERLRREYSMSALPILLATALGDSADVVEGLARGANDYVTKPLDYAVVIARIEAHLAAHRRARQGERLSRQLEFRSAFIRQAFGRDVSDDLLVEMSETPGAVELGGESRQVTAVVVDLAGVRSLARSLPSSGLVAVLNNALGAFTDVIDHYGGTLDGLDGDAAAALFGLPVPEPRDTERAVACAIALQLEMSKVNESNARLGLPEVAAAVGVATGEVVICGFGAGERLRYKAVGDPVVRAAAIEAEASPGEVWVCAATRALLGDLARIDAERDVALGGSQAEKLFSVVGIGGPDLISLR